jgi:endonuclease YncB( thermonuclease family)
MLKTLVVAGLGAALVPWLQPGWAEVRAGGLRTRVNGTALGSCGAGLCRVQGGTTAGDTLFLRFAQFDARGAIQGVNLDTRGQRHVVMGVSAPNGTFLDRPLRLDQPTNLVLLSPGGLWLGPGARVVQATNLVFSTSSHLRLGSSLVDVLGSSAAQLRQQAAPPAFDLNSFNDNATTLDGLGLQGAGPIVLAGPQLRIDRNLIIDSGSGGLSTAGPRRARLAAGDTLRLNGASIRLEALDLEAGTPSQDGMVQLTSPGRLSLERTGLQARALVLQGGDLHLGHSTLLAPKGQIRLVASGPGGAAHAITVEGSHLDVGARSRADLAKVVKGTVVVDGASIESNQPTPAIALFAEGDVLISGGSRLQASQDVPGIRARDPGPLTDVQLTSASGEVVVVAGGRLVVRRQGHAGGGNLRPAGRPRLQRRAGRIAGGARRRRGRLADDRLRPGLHDLGPRAGHAVTRRSA